MKNQAKVLSIGILLLVLIQGGNTAIAQEVVNDFQSRANVEIGLKPIKHLKLSLIPELRFDETFSLDEYHIETEIEYEVLDFLSLGAAYRFTVNPRETKATEYLNRFALSATAKKEFGRLEPAFRLRYSNYADDEITDKRFLRYKASVKYDIANCKITPFVAAEAFQQLNDFQLYKMRYSFGLDYKLFKKNYIGLSYKLDYYKNELRNRHIVSIGYKIKF